MKTETKQTHTPTPWKIDTDEAVRYISDAKGNEVFRLFTCLSEKNWTDAKFIVRAVNAHERLVAELRTAINNYENGYAINVNSMREAIAKAEKGQHD